MFKKSMPLAFVALAGCALAGTPQNSDTPQSANPPSTEQKASPTPTPTPLPKNIMRLEFFPSTSLSGGGVTGLDSTNGVSIQGIKTWSSIESVGFSVSGDMYIQMRISTDSIAAFCPTCSVNIDLTREASSAIFKKTNIKSEFEFITMGKKVGEGYAYYPRRDFAFFKLGEVIGEFMAPWVVKSVDVSKNKISFDTGVWQKNTAPLVLSEVASDSVFGLDDGGSTLENPDQSLSSCGGDVTCTNDRALAVVRERTAFTGTTAYFIGRRNVSHADKTFTIFRIHEDGSKEVVGKKISEYLAKHVPGQGNPANEELANIVYHFVYSQKDSAFYLTTLVDKKNWLWLYRISEDALVP